MAAGVAFEGQRPATVEQRFEAQHVTVGLAGVLGVHGINSLGWQSEPSYI